MECIELVKLKNMKAKMFKQRAGSGAHLELVVVEFYMGEYHS